MRTNVGWLSRTVVTAQESRPTLVRCSIVGPVRTAYPTRSSRRRGRGRRRSRRRPGRGRRRIAARRESTWMRPAASGSTVAGRRFAVVANLREAAERCGRLVGEPVRAVGEDTFAPSQFVARRRSRRGACPVSSRTTYRGSPKAMPSPLRWPIVKCLDAVVPADDGAVGGDDLARARCRPHRPSGGGRTRHGRRSGRSKSPGCRACRRRAGRVSWARPTNLGLAIAADREHHPRQEPAIDAEQHVRLVLRVVEPAAQARPTSAGRRRSSRA